jgi:hypothetical protein
MAGETGTAPSTLSNKDIVKAAACCYLFMTAIEGKQDERKVDEFFKMMHRYMRLVRDDELANTKTRSTLVIIS